MEFQKHCQRAINLPEVQISFSKNAGALSREDMVSTLLQDSKQQKLKDASRYWQDLLGLSLVDSLVADAHDDVKAKAHLQVSPQDFVDIDNQKRHSS
jgi:hypothetical protein